MNQAFICDAIRTPFGRYGGALSSVRTDDLSAIPLKALMARNPNVDWLAVTDVIYGCVNQAGEDNRNVAHMATLLAGLPMELPGATINRLCGSGLDAIGTAARAIKAGEASMMIAGGVESMSRAPFVMGKAESAFSRAAQMYDTTIGWRFVNKLMKEKYGVDAMPETAENVAKDYNISREDQDKMALASQLKAVAAQKAGYFDAELTPVTIPQKVCASSLLFADAPVFTAISVFASKTPSKCAVVPMVTAPATCQKIFLASAPPAKVTRAALAWVIVPATWKIQTSFGPPDRVTSVVIRRPVPHL